MKRIIILFFALGSILTYSQNKFKEFFTDLRTVEIAKIEKGLVQVTIDKESLIETINHHFSNEKNYFTDVELKMEEVEKRIVYYLYFSSSLLNRNLATFLDIENNKLKLRTEDKVMIRLTSCQGMDICYPRAMINPETDKFFFSCREFIGCVDEETAQKEPCTSSGSAIFYE